jgi:ABC-2 type transport system ATP-binding protein
LAKNLNKGGTTIFLTTHYIEEADQICQRVAIINKGRIVAIDSPEKLKTSSEKHQIIEVSFDQVSNLENKLSHLEFSSKVVQFGDKFRLHVRNTAEAVPLIIDFARENNLKIMSINTLSPSLEDAFVQMTGLNPEVIVNEKEQSKKAAGLG